MDLLEELRKVELLRNDFHSKQIEYSRRFVEASETRIRLKKQIEANEWEEIMKGVFETTGMTRVEFSVIVKGLNRTDYQEHGDLYLEKIVHNVKKIKHAFPTWQLIKLRKTSDQDHTYDYTFLTPDNVEFMYTNRFY